MEINIKEDSLKNGLLGLVVALVEIVRDALKIQALKRIDSGILREEECERLGRALMELDAALEKIKMEQGISESVQAVRNRLDDVVDEVIGKIANPERWQQETRVGG